MGSGRPDISKLHSLLVLNISFRTTAAELRERFQPYGELGDVYVPRGNGGVSRGYAFVRFIDKEEAEKARVNMDKTMVDGREIGVQIAKYGRPAMGASQQRRRRYSPPPPGMYSGGGGRRYSSPPRRYSPPSRRYSGDYERDRYERGYGGDGHYEARRRSPPQMRGYDRRAASPPRKRNRMDGGGSYNSNSGNGNGDERRYGRDGAVDEGERRFRRDAPERRPGPDDGRRSTYDERRPSGNSNYDDERRPGNYDDERRFKRERADEGERSFKRERPDERERTYEREPVADEGRYKREDVDSDGLKKEPGHVVDSPISAAPNAGRTSRGHGHRDEAY